MYCLKGDVHDQKRKEAALSQKDAGPSLLPGVQKPNACQLQRDH